jgi:hypothetical protein
MSLRVIQWATGNVGAASLRAIARHPELELVGLLVRDPAKDKRDAGELVGLDPLGVAATTNVAEILALDADCVAHMPLPSTRYGEDPDADTKDLCRLLESGKNVVTTVGYVYPKAYGPELVERLESACARGGVSLHGTGVNPGWLAELLPLVMSALSDRIDKITVSESTEFSGYPSPEIILEMLGMGRTLEVFEQSRGRYLSWLGGLFSESVHMLADGLAAPLDEIRTSSEIVLADAQFEIAAGTIPAGTVAGQRYLWEGIVGGEPRIALEAIYRAGPKVAPDWPAPGCQVRLDGRPRMQMDLSHTWLSNGLVGTALHAVHAIPHVCRAEPGIRTFLDLPLITGRHTLGAARP